MMNWTLVLQIASTLGGLATLSAVFILPWQIRKMRSETKKTDLDGAKVLSDTALAFLAPARAEIAELEKRLRSANDRANSLQTALESSQARVHQLEAEVQGLRNQVGTMSKEMTAIQDENSRLRGDNRS
jgi:predicted  nucleic acid-binding Zn-ribbon protein